MKLALFDLDHTLLPIDSADSWTRYLVRVGGLDVAAHDRRLREFGAGYHAGSFDVDGYLAYQMGLLASFRHADLVGWRDRFVAERVAPNVRPEARALIDAHRGDESLVALVTGTNRFVTGPIGALFGVPDVLAVEPERGPDGEFTGRYVGTHTYREGKVRIVEQFLEAHGTRLDRVADSTFYSDSVNDLPLLERVDNPVVTNGDAALRRIAAERGWRTLDLFELAPR
ncbi:MAG TPA: HAD-IB family hydrolase [Burkholderiaceae bacterium]|nr:HAD-IB family hydrolase [Burkholderiaceae bacterium]